MGDLGWRIHRGCWRSRQTPATPAARLGPITMSLWKCVGAVREVKCETCARVLSCQDWAQHQESGFALRRDCRHREDVYAASRTTA
jgi:hypothetical protein